jgi:hypothetical protein
MERNFDGIQFEDLRRTVDGKFNTMHDELTDCYYNKKPFQGKLLTKEEFDKFHGLIFHLYIIAFHQANLAQAKKDRIPEEKYNDITDEAGAVIAKKTDLASQEIARLKAEGFELVI